jgi:excisionase family DNA binding protein
MHEVATALGVSRATVRRWVQQGIIVPHKLGKTVPRVDAAQVEALLRGEVRA